MFYICLLFLVQNYNKIATLQNYNVYFYSSLIFPFKKWDAHLFAYPPMLQFHVANSPILALNVKLFFG